MNTSPLKIIGIISHSGEGGAQDALQKLRVALYDSGIDMPIYYLHYFINSPEERHSNTLVKKKAPLSIFARAHIFLELVRVIKRHKPDVVVAFLPFANTLGLLTAMVCGVRHRIASQRNPSSSYGILAKAFDSILGTIGVYTSVVANSHSVARSFSLYPANYRKIITVAPNYVLPIRVSSLSDGIRTHFNISSDTFLLLAVGRLEEQKCHEVLIRALPFILNAELIIVGEGSLRSKLSSLSQTLGVDSRVHLLGHLKKPELYSLMKSADVYVQSSSYEGQSNSLLEAMELGSLVVSSDIPAQREVIQPEGKEAAGILIPGADPELWGNVLAAIEKEPRRYQHLRERAKERASDFSAESMASGFLSSLPESFAIGV